MGASRSFALLVVLGSLAVSATARAQEAGTPVSLAQALAALPATPAAQASIQDIAAADGLIAAASAWPMPTVRVATNRYTARFVVGATLPLPIFGTVGAARRVAAAEAGVVRAEATLTQRELRNHVVVAWIALARADADLEASAIVATQAAELERIAHGKVDAGTGMDVDVTLTAAARARADVATRRAVELTEAASAELASLLGWEPTKLLRADGLPMTGDHATLAAWRARLGEHPERIAAKGRVAVAQANVDQILVGRWPPIALEGQIAFRDPTLTDPTTNQLLGPDASIGIAIDLPVFSRIGARARSARSAVAAQRSRLAATEAHLTGALVAAFERWDAATVQLQALLTEVLPLQEKASTQLEQAYREGTKDLSAVIIAERDLAGVRAEVNEARANAAVAYAELELAAGETQPPGAASSSPVE